MKLLQGDCFQVLKELPDNSLDSLVTDPPAGISFMGKEWDEDKGGRKQWVAWMTDVMREALRVLKPGAHGLVWALPRTSHWTATALEDAGFEVRDVVTHLFGSGFPKTLDVSKAIDKAAGAERKPTGRVKPGHEGFDGKGTAGHLGGKEGWDRPWMHDAEKANAYHLETAPATDDAKKWQGWGTALKPASEHWLLVRKPLKKGNTVAQNVLEFGTGALNIDASRIGSGGHHGGITGAGKSSSYDLGKNYVKQPNKIYTQGRFPANLVLDEEAAAMLDAQATQEVSRFFYVSKASKKDKGAENNHPTVKSTALMTYLIRMVTPPGGVVLDPFMGSGSTGVAAIKAGFGFLGIEQASEYLEIAKKRIAKEVK